MSKIERHAAGKLIEFTNDLHFENDLGESPLLLGHLTKDQSIIAIASLLGTFASYTVVGLPLAIAIASAAINDIAWISKGSPGRSAKSRPSTPPIVDATAETVEEEDYEEPFRAAQQAPRTTERREARSPKQTPSSKTSTPKGQRANSPFQEPDELSDEFEVDEEVAPRWESDCGSPASERSQSLPQVTTSTRQQLIARLREDCPVLLKLVKSHPIRAVGVQRSGKSTLVKKLALLRMVLLPNHQVIASTPHYEPKNPYPKVFKVVGLTPNGKRDYPAISKEWRSLAARVEDCQINSNTTIWDEFGLMDKVMPEEEIKSVLTSCLRETMKFGEYPIFILHGETAAFMPGSKGLVSVILNGTVRVETIGEVVEDADSLETIIPTGKFHVTWLNGTKDVGKIPDWLTEEYLLELLGNPQGQPFTISSAVGEPMRTILQKVKEKKDWITVAEIQKRDWKNVKGKTAKEIHEALSKLALLGLGEIDESGKSDSAVRFRVR